MLAEALRYVDLGWCIIPIKPGTKQPACRSWQQFQTEQPDRATLQRWFRELRSLAVVVGDVSGGLICRDFDEMPAYERWATQYPTLARTLPTVATGRPGRHVYCRGAVRAVQAASKTEATILHLGDGELRGGGYTLLPPSRHPSGHVYRWLVPPGNSIPCLDLAETGFLSADRATESNREDGVRQREQKNTEDSRGQKAEREKKVAQNGTSLVHTVAGRAADLTPEIEGAIVACLPTGPGRRNRMVFQLARGLKALPALADAKVNDLKPFVRHWHRLALAVIQTKAFDETWIDFLRAWPKVKYPTGSEPMTLIFARAMANELPPAAQHYDVDGIRALVALCCELQRAAGDGPFYLSVRTAGRLLNVDHSTAARWLFLLAHDGVLFVVERGSQEKRKATRFRYNAG